PLRHPGAIQNARFSPGGRRLITWGKGQTACVWNAATGALLAKLGHRGELADAFFSPDGGRVVTVASAAVLPRRTIRTVAPDGTTAIMIGVVLGFSKQTFHVRVWDPGTGRPLSPLLPHNAQVVQARFSPEGRRLLTLASDRTVRVWDMVSVLPAE